jgi:phosphatidylglycerophosphate synthase
VRLIWSAKGASRLKTSVEAVAPPLGLALGEGSARLWSMTSRERLRRIFLRSGLEPSNVADPGRPAVLARADWVFDESLIATLAKRPGSVLVTEEGVPVAAHVAAGEAEAAARALEAAQVPAGLQRLDPAELAYNSELRKREPPILVRLDDANVRSVEARTFQGSYKGVTDIVTKYLWPTPARIVTRWCAAVGLKPNHVTLVGLLLVIAAFWLFWRGQFGLGLVCAWIMTFLDTVDGKLARVTLTSSKVGNILDHGIDLIHPPFWWWAWWVGLNHLGTPSPYPAATLAVILLGYWLQRGEEGIFLRMFGFHVHAWRPFDSFFRLITARRNPNLLILTPAWAVGRPDIGLFLVGVWTGLSLLVHLAQIVQAAATPRAQVVSWLSR